MAIDQSAILQLLTQLQGGGTESPITPVSGIGQGTPLSGLPLGEQGMGFGGGGSLLGGPTGGLGGGSAGPGGLDLFQLLAQLQGGGDLAAAGTTFLGQPGGGGLGQGFGAGGQLSPQASPAAAPQQAGLGGGREALLALNLLKESLGLGRNLSGLGGPPTSPTASPSMTASLGGEFPESFGAVAGARFPPEFPIEATGTAAPGGGVFSQAGNILPTLPGAGFSAAEPAAISAPFLAGGGPESAGQLAGLGSEALGGSLPPVLPFLGPALGIGLGAASGGLEGALRGTGLPGFAGLGLPSPLPTAARIPLGLATGGLSELLGPLGSLFGFGGGTPMFDVFLPGFTHPIRQTAGGARTSQRSFAEGTGALGSFEQALQGATTPESLLAALNQQYSPFAGQFQVRSSPFINIPGFNQNFTQPFTLAALQNPEVIRGLQVFAGALGAPAEQPGVADFLRQRIGQLLPPPPSPSTIPSAVPPPLGGPPPQQPSGGPGPLTQFPGAPQLSGGETDPATLLALLRQMGLA